MSDRRPVTRLESNPFDVLEVRPGCTAMEIERAGAKLLAMLATGFEGAGTFRTPLGPRTRDADLVRRSLDALRDPEQRRLHGIWAALPPGDAVPDLARPWAAALDRMGWGRRP